MLLAGIFLIIIVTLVLLTVIAFFISGFTSIFYGAPYVPISKKLIKDLLIFGELSSQDIFYDLGSGDGRVLLSAVQYFNVKKAVGCEISPWPYLKSRILARNLGLRILVKRENILKTDLADATFVFMYLFPRLIDEVVYRIEVRADSGTKILCPGFEINLNKHPGLKLIKSKKVDKIMAYLYEKL